MKKTILSILAMVILVGCVTGAGTRAAFDASPKLSAEITPKIITETVPFGTISLSASSPNWYGYIQSFQLTITNTSQEDISLDWNKVLFINNGQTDGGFMFEGVVYSKRNEQKPNDVVFAGSTFSKTIWPNSIVSYNGGRHGTGWLHGALDGKVGAYITINYSQKTVSNKFILDIRYTPIANQESTPPNVN